MRLFIAAAIAALAVSPLAAQAPAEPPAAAASPDAGADARAKLLAMDTDRSGSWSKDEWLAGGRRERGFAMMDADRDGQLTPSELKAGVARLQAMRR